MCTERRPSHSLALGHPCVGEFINTALSTRCRNRQASTIGRAIVDERGLVVGQVSAKLCTMPQEPLHNAPQPLSARYTARSGCRRPAGRRADRRRLQCRYQRPRRRHRTGGCSTSSASSPRPASGSGRSTLRRRSCPVRARQYWSNPDSHPVLGTGCVRGHVVGKS
jgi:hypothetical protein